MPSIVSASGPIFNMQQIPPQRMMTPGQQQTDFDLQRQQFMNNLTKIYPKIVISPEFQSMLGVTPGNLLPH